MERADENCVQMMRSTRSQDVPMEGVKLASEIARNSERRALSDIKNFIGAPHQPCTFSKRDLVDKTKMDSKNKGGFIGNRPITRRFAATLANQKTGSEQDPTRQAQSESEIHKSLAVSVPDINAFHSSEEMECKGEPDNLPMISEVQEMESTELMEVEMEDIEETAHDIDICDLSNPLAVVEYVEDIYNFYRKTEDLSCVSPNYMSNQFDINEKMRAILIDWLIEVHYKFELLVETLFLTVNIIDRFLARHAVVRKKLQLVGVTAMLLACKYEEVTVPVVEDLILICDRAYTRAEILEMERMIVNTLQFNMSFPTPYVFMRRFLKAAESDKKLELLSFFMIELCLVEYQMLKFPPSLLAAAAIYTAQCTMTGLKCWTKCCELHTKYSEDQLLECSSVMVEFHQKAGNGKLTGVHRKYSTFKYGCAAKSEPAAFLLEQRL